MSLYKLLFYTIDPDTKVIHGLSRKLFINALSSLINTSGTDAISQSLGKLYTASTNNINVSNIEGCNSIIISNIIQSASSTATLGDNLKTNFNQLLSSESNNISKRISSNVDNTISNINYEEIKSYNPYYLNKLNKILKLQPNYLSSDIEKIFEIYSVACDNDVYTLSSITNKCENTNNVQQNMYAFNKLLITLLNINNLQFYITDDDSFNINESLSSQISNGSNCMIDSLARNNVNVSNFKCNQSGDIVIKDVSQQTVSSINNTCIFTESTTKLLANSVYYKLKNRYDSIFDYINNMGLSDEQLTYTLNMFDIIVGSNVEKIISAAGMLTRLDEVDEDDKTITPTIIPSGTSSTSSQSSGASSQSSGSYFQPSGTYFQASGIGIPSQRSSLPISSNNSPKLDTPQQNAENIEYSESTSFTDYVEPEVVKKPETFMDKIKNNYIWIIIGCVICLILIIIILYFSFKKKDVPENNDILI